MKIELSHQSLTSADLILSPMELAREWLSGTSEPVANGYGPNGPYVQLQRPGGEMALLDLRAVSGALLAATQREERLKQAMVEAVIPLEAIIASGADAHHCPELRNAIREGVIAVRAVFAEHRNE